MFLVLALALGMQAQVSVGDLCRPVWAGAAGVVWQLQEQSHDEIFWTREGCEAAVAQDKPAPPTLKQRPPEASGPEEFKPWANTGQPISSPCTLTYHGETITVACPTYKVVLAPKPAAPDDGETPDYTVVPVTQAIPICKEGYKLKKFVPAYHPFAAVFADGGTYPMDHDAYWEDTTPPNANITFPEYRCFPEVTAQ